MNVLHEVLNVLEKWDKIPMGDYGSENFFLNSMELATRNLKIAERIKDLYLSPKNHVQMNALTTQSK